MQKFNFVFLNCTSESDFLQSVSKAQIDISVEPKRLKSALTFSTLRKNNSSHSILMLGLSKNEIHIKKTWGMKAYSTDILLNILCPILCSSNGGTDSHLGCVYILFFV